MVLLKRLMYGQGPYSVLSVALSYVMQYPNCSNDEFFPHLTSAPDLGQEHPVLELLSGMNQGGQAAAVCFMRPDRMMSKNKMTSVTLNILAPRLEVAASQHKAYTTIASYKCLLPIYISSGILPKMEIGN